MRMYLNKKGDTRHLSKNLEITIPRFSPTGNRGDIVSSRLLTLELTHTLYTDYLLLDT